MHLSFADLSRGARNIKRRRAGQAGFGKLQLAGAFGNYLSVLFKAQLCHYSHALERARIIGIGHKLHERGQQNRALMPQQL